MSAVVIWGKEGIYHGKSADLVNRCHFKKNKIKKTKKKQTNFVAETRCEPINLILTVLMTNATTLPFIHPAFTLLHMKC